MAFHTTRQDHIHDSVKSILYSDPYANEPDTMSASKMLKERRKQEVRELYYKTLPIKEKHDVARGVLTNVYQQQLDIPSRAPASVVPHVIASSFSNQRVDPNAPPPTPPDAPPRQTLVTNLVGGKYYGNRGPLLRDLGVPTRSLGHRHDQRGFSGSFNGESAVPSSSAGLRSASASKALGQGFVADSGRSSWGQRSNSQTVVKGSLRTTPDMVTANMQYGSHTRKGLSGGTGGGGGISNFDDEEFMANDQPYSAHKKPHEGEPFYPQHSRKSHDDVDFTRSQNNNNTANEMYDEVSYCTNTDIFPNRTEPAPWDKDSAYHSGDAQQQRAMETAGSGKVQIVPKSGHGRFGQERQNFIAPAATQGTTDPAKLQRFALGQPNRAAEGGASPTLTLASVNENQQAILSANNSSREAGIGTHSNDFNGRRPDPASDLVNCETGLSVHHRGVGVTEAAFRPEYISHEGAHDKTVQRGGWMLAGRDANRAYASGVADPKVARAAGTVGGVSTRPTQTDGRKDELPSKEEMQRGFNVLPEENPRGGLGGFNNIPRHQLDSDGAESVYPPPHAQQQHYFEAAATSGATIGSSANTSINPEYWHRLHDSFAKGPSDPYSQAVISAVKRGDPIPGGTSSATAQVTRSRSVGQLPHHHHGRPIATGVGVSVPPRATLQRMKGDAARNATLGVVPSSTLVRESKNGLDVGGGRAVAVGTRGLSGVTDAEVRRFETQRSSSANQTLSRNSRFGNRPQDTMLRLF